MKVDFELKWYKYHLSELLLRFVYNYKPILNVKSICYKIYLH